MISSPVILSSAESSDSILEKAFLPRRTRIRGVSAPRNILACSTRVRNAHPSK